MVKKIFGLFILLIATSANSQIANNRNLPIIDVMSLNDNAFEAGKISVKFSSLHRNNIQIISKDNAEIVFNNTSLNILSHQFHFKKITSIFSTVLKNSELKNKHQHWGLDLWFTIEFDATQSVQQLYTNLKKLNLFEVVEPVYKKHLLDEDKECAVNYVPNDPRLNEQWHYDNKGQGGGKIGKDIKLFDAWDIETGKPNVLVAVHDQGIQLDHPDLAQNIAVGKSFNFIDNNDTIVMGYHGTHTAGTIAAVNNNGIGVSGIAGGDGSVNSGVRLMSMQIFKGNQSAGLAEGFVFAADKGAAISSNSWAYDIENIYEISVMDAIDYFIENAGGSALQGGLVIFAAGNVSRTIKYYPSTYDRVICVSATNNRDTKANYSTFGSWVDIAAPGGDYNAFGASQVLSTTANSGYAGDHGTSMACPHVAGVAALIASKLSGKASASDVRDILLTTTDNIDSLNPNFIGLLGTGRLNALKALTKAQAIFNGLNVDAVDSLKAIYNCNSIQLNWKKNIASNDVMIAYTNKNGFGSLVNGNIYNIGDDIVGGGKVIYKGNATNFSLANNDSFLHYFKVWSVDVNNNYSFGKTAEIVAAVAVRSSGAIQQNFDFPPYFPTQEWRTINPDNDISWIHTAADSSNTGAGDLFSMCMYNYSYNSLLGAVDVLTSPLINVQNTDSINLNFWYAYKYRNTGFAIADSFEVLVSNDCGNSYSSLWKKAGTDLATVNYTGDTAFYPFGIEKWEQVTINLTSYKNNSKLMFAFRTVNGQGNNLFLDNVVVDVRYKTDVALTQIISPTYAMCDTLITPQVVIKNIGNDAITSLKIDYVVDATTIVNTVWNGLINKGDSTIINLSSTSLNRGNHTIKIYTYLPNNVADNFVLNDSFLSNFFITPINNLPINEGFENPVFPPSNWYINQTPKDAISWTKTNLAGSASASSCLMQNFVYDNKKRVDDLITPIFKSTNNLDSCYLIFDYAHATRFVPTSVGIDFDSLEISVSNDCGTSWQSIWKKGGNSLQTINQTQSHSNEFIPQIGNWKTDSVYIPTIFSAGNQMQLRFRSIENFGNNLYLDNIKIFSKYAPQIITPVKFGNYDVKVQYSVNNDFKNVTNLWNTIEEINTSHFNIQRSFDGISFIKLGRVEAEQKASNYIFIDNLTGLENRTLDLYYRLQIVDKNGTVSYSIIKKVTVKNMATNSFQLFPNPAKDVLKVILGKGFTTNHIIIKITDLAGKLLLKKSEPVINGVITLNLKSVQQGTYILNIATNLEVFSKRFVVIKD